jgi:hypothetical protein
MAVGAANPPLPPEPPFSTTVKAYDCEAPNPTEPVPPDHAADPEMVFVKAEGAFVAKVTVGETEIDTGEYAPASPPGITKEEGEANTDPDTLVMVEGSVAETPVPDKL